MQKKMVASALACAASLGLCACGGDNSSSDMNGGTPSGPNTASQQIDLTATDFAFTPNQVAVQTGASVKFVVHNSGANPHSLALELPSGEVELQSPISPGATGELSATMPSTAGSFGFYCPVPGHKEAGMTGTVTVQAKPTTGY